MMKLWHCRDARSFRPLWALEELGLPYELVMLPFPPRWMEPSYLELNPLGTIPFFTDGEVQMTESAAICQRIAAGTSLELRPDEPDYLPYLNWLHRSDATLTFPLTIVLRYTRLEPKDRQLPQAVEDYKAFFMGRAKAIETALDDGRDWLVGGRFTIADICVGYAVHLASSFGYDAELGPLTQSWYQRLKDRPGFASTRQRERDNRPDAPSAPL